MARYIDANALLELINEDCKYKNLTNEYTRGCNEVCDWAIKTIRNMPAADVVPKSEVEELNRECESLGKTVNEASKLIRKLKGKVEEAKTEVVKEIFEVIETVIGEKYNRFVFKNQPYDSDEETEAIINYSDSVSDGIAELKKKYTEGASEIPKKDFFTPEDVRKMSKKELRQNHQAIMNSIKEW